MKKIRSGAIRSHFIRHYPLYISLFIFCILLACVQWVKYCSGRYSIFDLGVFDQALWTFLIEGKPLHSINFPGAPFNWLGFHFSPLVLIISPLYMIEPSAFLLCIIQILLVASAVIPIFLSIKALGLENSESHILAVLFLAHPFILNGVSWDFHEVSFAVPLISWGLYAVIKRHFPLLFVTTTLLLLVKEHYGLAVIGFGALWIFYTKDWVRGVGLGLFGVIALAAVLFLIMPTLNPSGAHSMLLANAKGITTGIERYAWLHEPVSQAFQIFLIDILMQLPTFIFLLLVFLSFGTPSLKGAHFFLAGIADLTAAMLSLNPMMRSPFAYHSMPLVPVMTIAMAYGLRSLKRRERRNFLIGASIIIGTLGYFFGPFPFPGAIDIWQVRHAALVGVDRPMQIDRIRKIIPREASISVQPNIGYFFSQRRRIYAFPEGEEADFVILFLDYPFDNFSWRVFNNPFEGKKFIERVHKLLSDMRRPIAFYDSAWLVFEKAKQVSNNKEQKKLRSDALKRLERMSIKYRTP